MALFSLLCGTFPGFSPSQNRVCSPTRWTPTTNLLATKMSSSSHPHYMKGVSTSERRKKIVFWQSTRLTWLGQKVCISCIFLPGSKRLISIWSTIQFLNFATDLQIIKCTANFCLDLQNFGYIPKFFHYSLLIIPPLHSKSCLHWCTIVRSRWTIPLVTRYRYTVIMIHLDMKNYSFDWSGGVCAFCFSGLDTHIRILKF